MGSDFSKELKSSTKFIKRSVLIGPGAILIHVIFFSANILLKLFNILVRPTLKELERISLSSGFLIVCDDIRKMYSDIQRWGSLLIHELSNRDTVIESTPASNIYSVVTITSIGRPRKGDIAYSASTGKFKGYVSLGSETSWQDLN